MTNIATADAMIGCFNAKYHYSFWRPITAIRRDSQNPDPEWLSLLVNPNHAEYPSAHGCWTSAATGAMRSFFGTDDVAWDWTNQVGTVRHYDRLSDVMADVFMSRIWSGIHYGTSLMEGVNLGSSVAQQMADRFFKLVN